MLGDSKQAYCRLRFSLISVTIIINEVQRIAGIQPFLGHR